MSLIYVGMCTTDSVEGGGGRTGEHSGEQLAFN